jgi:hypothetical protein
VKFPYRIIETPNIYLTHPSDSNGLNSELEILEFDLMAFTNYPTSDPNLYSNIIHVIDQVSPEGTGNRKLMMTEIQFIKHHTYVNFVSRNKITVGEDDQTKPGNQPYTSRKPGPNEGRSRFTSAQKILIQNKNAWYAHWSQKINLPDLNERMELIQPKNMRNTVITYLFFIEMIETILPRSTSKRNQIGSELEEAFQILQEIFNPDSSEEWKDQRNYIFKKVVIQLSAQNAIPGCWKLILLWVKTFRSDLMDGVLIDYGEIPHTVKSFSNTLFFFSIENLSKRLRK